MALEYIEEGKKYKLELLCIHNKEKVIVFETPTGDHIPLRNSDIECVSPENGIKNTEPAPKYDPNRLFREGDKVRIKREINGRLLHHSFVNFKHDTVYTVDADEVQKDFKSGHVVITDGKHYCSLSFYELELVTPVEELEPYSVTYSTDTSEECGRFEVVRGEQCVSIYPYGTHETRYYKKAEHAKAAAEAERDRLNAEYRKECEND